MLFSEKEMFSCVWLHFKKFSEKYFLVFGEEEGKDKPKQTQTNPEEGEDGAIAPLVDWRSQSMSGVIDKRARWTIAPLIDRVAHRSTSAFVEWSHRSSINEQRDRQSVLSDLGSLFSLSLSLSVSLSFSENNLKWKWGCKIIYGSKVKISINRKPFSGKWNLSLLPNTWVWGKMIS